MNKRLSQTGLAMVIVLWVISLLTIMAGSFALTMRRETTVVSAIKDNAVALAAAETGVAIAQQMLLLADENQRWRADGSIYQLQYLDAEIRIRIFSEQGKIDINKADEVLLTEMIQSVSEALELESEQQQQLVSAILDWRDEDDLVRHNGAEKQEYEEAGLSYHPANKSFQLVNELQMVLGMNTDVYQQLIPLITVYSSQEKVDLQVASKEVLQAVGKLDQQEVDEFVQQRTENNQAQVAPATLSVDNSGGKQAGGNKQVYTIQSQAKLYAEQEAGIKVTIKNNAGVKSESPFQVLDWQQEYQGFSLFSDEMEQILITQQDESEHKH